MVCRATLLAYPGASIINSVDPVDKASHGHEHDDRPKNDLANAPRPFLHRHLNGHYREHSNLPPPTFDAPASDFGSRAQSSMAPVHRFSRTATVSPSDVVLIVQWFVIRTAAAISPAPTTIAIFRPIPRVCASGSFDQDTPRPPCSPKLARGPIPGPVNKLKKRPPQLVASFTRHPS